MVLALQQSWSPRTAPKEELSMVLVRLLSARVPPWGEELSMVLMNVSFPLCGEKSSPWCWFCMKQSCHYSPGAESLAGYGGSAADGGITPQSFYSSHPGGFTLLLVDSM